MQDNNVVQNGFTVRYNDQTGEPLLEPASPTCCEGSACDNATSTSASDSACEFATVEAPLQNAAQQPSQLYNVQALGSAQTIPRYHLLQPELLPSADRFAQMSKLYDNNAQPSSAPVSQPLAAMHDPWNTSTQAVPQEVPKAFLPSTAADPYQALDIVPPAYCAGFFTRFAAFFIDSLIVWLMGIIVGIGLGVMSNSLAQPVFFTFSAISIIKYLIAIVYFVLLTKFTGFTVGKKLLRIMVVSSDKKSLSWWNVIYRETIGRYLSSILYIGYLVLAFDKKHRAFHDMLCDTRVVFV